MRIVPLGDSAVLVELGTTVDETLNEQAIEMAARVRASGIAAFSDVVPAYASLAVHFDPARLQFSDAVRLVEGCVRVGNRQPGPAACAAPVKEIPVWYDASTGSDLESIAEQSGCTVGEVVQRHTAPAYRVYMLGFLPGFPYLGTVDDSIAVPRHPSPRARVPAGSVGIAGHQTGIYPRESPGGWQIIGRTPLVLFDAQRTPPALLAPGDTVRFVPITEADFRLIADGRRA